MEIIFSRHAKLKILQRKISEKFITKTIKNPDFETPSYNFRTELFKNFGKNFLKVIVRKEGDKIVVITTHWVEKIKKK